MKPLRHFLEASILFIVLVFSKILPAHWASGIGGFIGHNLGPRLKTSHNKALAHIKYAMPNISDDDAQKNIIGMWNNLGRVIMEYPHLEHIGRDRTEIIGSEILEKYKDTPVILFTAHLANWEVCPIAALVQHDFKVSSIYRAPNNPLSNKMLRRARSMKGALKTIPKSKSGTRNLVKALKNNEHIGILIDQKYNEGIEAKFFNKPAMTSPAFAVLAQKFDCPLIPLKIERVNNGCEFKMTILPPLNINDKTVEEIVTESHHMLEQWIKEQPSGWLWLHQRWKLKNKKE